MKPSFSKGQPIRASDLNALADMACSNIIGGRGCAVTRLGKKIVVSQRPSQSLQRGSLYGNVWKLSAASGRVKWGFDTGGEAYSVCAAPNGTVYVVGERNNDWSDGGDYANVWRLSSSGALVWAVDIGTSDDTYEVQATNDAVFVAYFDSTQKIVKLDPADGSVVGSVLSTLFGSAISRRGFGINSTQLWTWQTVSSAQGVVAYDHDFSLIYSVTPPVTGLCDSVWGIGVSDDLVAFGTVYSERGLSLGTTTNTLGVTNTNIAPPVTQFVVAETASASGAPTPYEIHANVDCEENYIAAAYYAQEGNRATVDQRLSIARLYDTSGTRLHDIWLSETSTGPAGENNDTAVDESANLFFYASAVRIAYMEGVAIDGAAANPYRGLFAFDINTGAITWKWSPSASEDGSGANALYSVFADRNGHVYTTALGAAREPFMKVGD